MAQQSFGFKPGQSGNPGGRSKVNVKVRQLARSKTERAIRALDEALDATRMIPGGKDAPPIEHPDHHTRCFAANILLNRGWGSVMTEEQVEKADAGLEDAGASDAKTLVQGLSSDKLARILHIAKEPEPAA